MRTSLFLPFAFSLCLIFSACQKEKPKQDEALSQVSIRLEAKHLASDTVKVLTFDILNGKSKVLAETVLDAEGKGEMDMKLEHGQFATLDYQLADPQQLKSTQLYLEPGDSLTITVDGEASQTLRFEGEGAKVNNYLAASFLVRQPFFKSGGKLIWQLEQQLFLDRLDSIRFSMQIFLQQYADSIEMDADMRALMEKRNEIDVLKEEVGYAFLLQNNFGVEAISNGDTVREYQLPEAFSGLYQRIPYDSSLLQNHMPNYASILQKSVDATVFFPLVYGTSAEERKKMSMKIPSMIDSLIRTQYDQIKFPDYFLAWYINLWLNKKGISPDVDSLYQQFVQKNSSSPYLASLEEEYDRWRAISAGSTAPDFYGTTPDGKKMALSDLKGKVVYIDVWATWCRPCRQEFPASIALQKEFAEEEDVRFLYVSIDKDDDAWQKYLEEHSELTGIHMLDDAPEKESIMEKYLISGIPRYILIDQEGKIQDSEADRPSSGKVADQISALLN